MSRALDFKTGAYNNGGVVCERIGLSIILDTCSTKKAEHVSRTHFISRVLASLDCFGFEPGDVVRKADVQRILQELSTSFSEWRPFIASQALVVICTCKEEEIGALKKNKVIETILTNIQGKTLKLLEARANHVGWRTWARDAVEEVFDDTYKDFTSKSEDEQAKACEVTDQCREAIEGLTSLKEAYNKFLNEASETYKKTLPPFPLDVVPEAEDDYRDFWYNFAANYLPRIPEEPGTLTALQCQAFLELSRVYLSSSTELVPPAVEYETENRDPKYIWEKSKVLVETYGSYLLEWYKAEKAKQMEEDNRARKAEEEARKRREAEREATRRLADEADERRIAEEKLRKETVEANSAKAEALRKQLEQEKTRREAEKAAAEKKAREEEAARKEADEKKAREREEAARRRRLEMQRAQEVKMARRSMRVEKATSLVQNNTMLYITDFKPDLTRSKNPGEVEDSAVYGEVPHTAIESNLDQWNEGVHHYIRLAAAAYPEKDIILTTQHLDFTFPTLPKGGFEGFTLALALRVVPGGSSRTFDTAPGAIKLKENARVHQSEDHYSGSLVRYEAWDGKKWVLPNMTRRKNRRTYEDILEYPRVDRGLTEESTDPDLSGGSNQQTLAVVLAFESSDSKHRFIWTHVPNGMKEVPVVTPSDTAPDVSQTSKKVLVSGWNEAMNQGRAPVLDFCTEIMKVRAAALLSTASTLPKGNTKVEPNTKSYMTEITGVRKALQMGVTDALSDPWPELASRSRSQGWNHWPRMSGASVSYRLLQKDIFMPRYMGLTQLMWFLLHPKKDLAIAHDTPLYYSKVVIYAVRGGKEELVQPAGDLVKATWCHEAEFKKGVEMARD